MMNVLIFRKKLTYVLSLILLFGYINNYAAMPHIFCNSICPNVPTGAHCIQVGQNKIYYRTLGNQSPTIIFSSGTGFPSDEWYNTGIATALANKTAVLAYDRIFTFNSCPNVNHFMPVTAQDVVDQLRQLLQQQKIKPPYILVGHSMGGLYMLLYAREYPNDVKALVLLDASSDQGPTPMPKNVEPILKKLGNPQNPKPEDPLYNELIGQLPSYLQIRNAPPLSRKIPVIVLYATKHCLPRAWTKTLMCMTKEQEDNHKKGQIAMYNMSDNHRLIEVKGDHNSFFDKNKNEVIKALNNILRLST